MLAISQLTKTYGGVLALDDVALNVREGELFGLLGPNGAGKTTLVSIVSTLLPFDAGTVSVSDYDVRTQPRHVRAIISLAPQEGGLYAPLTGLENLTFFAGLYGIRGQDLKQRVEYAIEVAGLGEQRARRVSTFSGGMKRRLSLAIALLHRPSLLLLDEPTTGVDPQSRHHIIDAIRELNRTAGTTVVYTTHYMDEVEELCERVAIIDHGRIVACDSVGSLLSGFGDTVVIFQAPANDRFGQRLRAEVAVAHLSSQNGLYQIGVKDLQRTLPQILGIAEEEGVPLGDVRMTRPSLEQAFLSLTGRELRD